MPTHLRLDVNSWEYDQVCALKSRVNMEKATWEEYDRNSNVFRIFRWHYEIQLSDIKCHSEQIVLIRQESQADNTKDK